MAVLMGESGRSYTTLPIDVTVGFPQSFQVTFEQRTYRFFLYVDIESSLLAGDTGDLFDLPMSNAFLVARVDQQNPDGTSATVFLRKVVPEMEYLSGDIALYFPSQTVARMNLNGRGDFGSYVVGGIASRWA